MIAGKGLGDTKAIGFDDVYQYEDFKRPLSDRRVHIEQIYPELGARAYQSWMDKADRHAY